MMLFPPLMTADQSYEAAAAEARRPVLNTAPLAGGRRRRSGSLRNHAGGFDYVVHPTAGA
jgi:hypothetical protein